jgi:hypothetical protein
MARTRRISMSACPPVAFGGGRAGVPTPGAAVLLFAAADRNSEERTAAGERLGAAGAGQEVRRVDPGFCRFPGLRLLREC